MKQQGIVNSGKRHARLPFIISLLLLCAASASHAQIHLKANVQNNHLWRGMEVADGAVLLANLSYSFPGSHATVGLWGGTNANGSYKEFNHYVRLSARGFSLAFCDTYNFSPGATYNNREYFNYSAHSTGRFLDCALSYRLAGKVPLLVSWSTILFGRDRSADNRHQKYSTFAYAECPVWQNDNWTVEVGAGCAFALNRAGDDSHFYGDDAGLIHLALAVSRRLVLGSYTLPVYARGQWNPQSSCAYFQIGAEVLNF